MLCQRVGTVCAFWALLFCALPEAPAQEEGSYVNFNFDQVDLRLLVKIVGDMTGKRFVVDQGVAGKVTVVTPPRIPANEVYPLFIQILESAGYSVIDKGGVEHIVSLVDQGVPSAPVVTSDSAMPGSGIITKVLRLESISAVDLKGTLEPLVRTGKAGGLMAFGPSNHLIITDTVENVARIERIIAELDKPGASRTVDFVRLKNTSADEVAGQLLLAMKGVETANKAISRHIQQVAGGAGALPTDVVVVPAANANGLVLVGTRVQLGELRRIIDLMDVERASGYGRLNAIFLQYLDAEEAAKSLNALLAKTVEKDQRQSIAIEPSVPNNALIVDAAPQDFEYVKLLVTALDQVPQQVMVEILIAEVTMGKDLDLGVEWSTIEQPEDGSTTVIGRSRPGSSDGILNLSSAGTFAQGITFGIASGTFIDSSGNVVPRIPFLLRALAANQDVKILSSVPLRAQNNTEASVSVVKNIPILKSTIEGGSGTARDVIQNIDRMDVGIKLRFTPHVNPNREITMELNPSIEAIVEESTANTPFTPTIAKREVSTTVTVKDRTSIIISGLIREDRYKTVSKVPLLGDIPLIGWLFRSTQDTKQRTNLLIFVTPHIVTDQEAAAEVQQRLIDQTGIDSSPTNLNMQTSGKK